MGRYHCEACNTTPHPVPRHRLNKGHTHQFVKPTVAPFAPYHESTVASLHVVSVCMRLSCSALPHLYCWPRRDLVQCLGVPRSVHVSVRRHVPFAQSSCGWQTGAMASLVVIEVATTISLTLFTIFTTLVLIITIITTAITAFLAHAMVVGLVIVIIVMMLVVVAMHAVV